MEISLAGEAEELERDDRLELEIAKCNADSVETFRSCSVEIVGAGFGAISTGISPQQILASVQLLRIKKRKWPEILEDVVYMGQVVAEVRNSKIKKPT